MERLTIDEIIAHCERVVVRKEEINSRDFFETRDMGHYPMKEYWEHRQVAEYLEELKDYRKAEEQGLLIRLPVAEGTTVFGIIRYFFRGRNENQYEICECKFELPMLREIGKTVFLTREEAESALAEKGGA